MGCINNKYIEAGMEERETEERERKKKKGWVSTIAGAEIGYEGCFSKQGF